jgi:D-amino-acid dehydrogenase
MKEVIIVGGGIIGVCTAHALHEAGMHVTVVDAGDFNSGCTYGNAGMIVPSHIVPLASPGMMAKGLKWMFDRKSPFFIRPRLDMDLMRWLWLFYKSSTAAHVNACAPILRDMHEASKAAFASWSTQPGFDFDYVADGILMVYNSKAGEHNELEGAAFANELGLRTKSLTGDSLHALEPLLQPNAGAVHYPGDATLSPDTFMQQMIQRLKQHGVDFLSKTKITNVSEEGSGCSLLCADGKVLQSKYAIIANGIWSGKLMKASGYTLPMQDGKGYSMTSGVMINKPRIASILHEARVAVTPMGDRLRVSGTLEISGLDDKVRPHKVQAIADSLTEYYHKLHLEISEKPWFGYRPCSPDGMPYIGRMHDGSNVIVASGHAMMGLSLAPATGTMIRDMILKNVEPPLPLQPGRFRLRSR